MKVLTYMCENCLEPFEFDPSEDNDFLCPKCGEKMMYWETDEVDPKTNKVLESYDELDRRQANPGKPIIKQTTVECPYCHSKNTKKISEFSKVGRIALFGIYGAGKLTKQWHCKNCNSDF